MAAKFIEVGTAVHDSERLAIRYLVDGLPSTYTVYGNPWLVERNGSIFEVDAVVVAPHAVYIVEIKGYRGRIEGTDNDWWIPERIRSPLKLNRQTAQVLKSRLRQHSHLAGQVWVEGFVFLSATSNVGVKGPASDHRIYTRASILAALQDEALASRLAQGRSLPPTVEAERAILELFAGAQSAARSGRRPLRQVREYTVDESLEHHEAWSELLATHRISSERRVLRIYTVPPLATDAERARILERARWEAQVLGRLGRAPDILKADPPFEDEAGIVLPFERFNGITLTSWVERYGPKAPEKTRANLRARTDLWLRLAAAVDEVHRQGVVHRLLRPEVILVADEAVPAEVRITGFDLAKQLPGDGLGSAPGTVFITTMDDGPLHNAAPEVLNAFSSAEPASDQFSLGALLALLLTGRPLFEHTREVMAARRLLRRVRDLDPRLPLRLDEAVAHMLELRAPDRFADLTAAMAAVREGRETDAHPQATLALPARAVLDPDNLDVGARVGADYEILSRLGQGGMSVVYSARHLVSGRTRALKIARTDASAEDALRGEYKVLDALDHPNIVRVIDLTKMIEGRLTLVMERVGGQTLRQYLAAHAEKGLDSATQRRLAEDLLAGLDHLEQKGVTHKDLKPDNLVVGDDQLTIIDFSLADLRADAIWCGTPLYRDPGSARWSAGTDRYAAALCLFELYAGRHAFDGRVPEPDEQPLVSADDIAPSGLAAFFHKALNPVPERRFASAKALREALLLALGDDLPASAPPVDATRFDATTPLASVGLSRRALNALSRCQVRSVGALLGLNADQVRSIHAIGSKTATDIIALQATLRAQGIVSTAPVEAALVPDLAHSPEPVQHLALTEALRAALLAAHLTTVGAVARLSRNGLLAVPGIGQRKYAQVLGALHKFSQVVATEGAERPSLDGAWDRACLPLTDVQRAAIEAQFGLLGEVLSRTEQSQRTGRTAPQLSNDFTGGNEQLDVSALSELIEALDQVLDGFGGVARVLEVGARLNEFWPSQTVHAPGMVRLLAHLSAGRAHVCPVDGVDGGVVARPAFGATELEGFVLELLRLAGQWPPGAPDAVRRALGGVLPHFTGDPLSLGMRLVDDLRITETGHLYLGPLDARYAIQFVLEQHRDPIELDTLRARVLATFGEDTPYPEPSHLIEVLREIEHCIDDRQQVVHRDAVAVGRAGGIPGRTVPPALVADPPPVAVVGDRSHAEVVRDMLRDAARSRGFRMLVTPPERHGEIGRSIAPALVGSAEAPLWLSFDDAFFTEHAEQLPALERAERFAAQRGALTEAAEATLQRLLDAHGRPGRTVVLGDTALWGLCDALDLPRRLYDETLSGRYGFWVLVVPGGIYNRQPRFNEGPALWHLEGATVALLHPLTPNGQPRAGEGTGQ